MVDHAQSHATRDEVIRWFVTFVIGVATGLAVVVVVVVVVVVTFHYGVTTKEGPVIVL